MPNEVCELRNGAYHLSVEIKDGELFARLVDLAMDFVLAEGPYVYRLSRPCAEGRMVIERVGNPQLSVDGETIQFSGSMGELALEHRLGLPAGRPIMEERIVLYNPTAGTVSLEGFAAGFQRRISNRFGGILAELESDVVVPVPLRHRATDPPGFDWDLSMVDLATTMGREQRVIEASVPSTQWLSEGWAWIHGEHALGVFKFDQEAMVFSVLSPEVCDDGLALRFGGFGMVAGEPSVLGRVEPGQSVQLGVTRYQTVRGGHQEACYAFRSFLDEQACRFPKDYNPPVHWNELYDNPEWHLRTPGKPKGPRPPRAVTYTKALMEAEAAKAREYGCEALYLDPGWDTAFGTFLWGEEWLGPRKDFIEQMRERYGLGVSLHCPLATWMSSQGGGVSSWPEEGFRMGPDGEIVQGSVCLGSKQYLDVAAQRLIEHCTDGVVFLMFDGNAWNETCWNPEHGHPVPYTMEDHMRANCGLARRIHEQHPHVLIEMHDMIAGGSRQRYTPVYYKYGLPGSYDENWGFELMWSPLEDILSGRARSLYYYSLGCNVPMYLHVDLRDDNEHCLVLWWYASTCRHLGIGGTHSIPAVAQAQKLAMKKYRELEQFYKRGEFYGMHEEAHVHVLPEESAFVVNLFNLSDGPRVISGSIPVEKMGLDRDRWYVSPKGGGFDAGSGQFSISRRMAPWSADVAEVYPVGSS